MASNDNDILFGADFVRGDETDGTYDFYQFQRSNTGWVIMRLTKNKSEAKYAVGIAGTFESAWTNKLTSTVFEFPAAYPAL